MKIWGASDQEEIIFDYCSKFIYNFALSGQKTAAAVQKIALKALSKPMSDDTIENLGELLSVTLEKTFYRSGDWVEAILSNFGSDRLRLLGVEILSKCMSFTTHDNDGLVEKAVQSNIGKFAVETLDPTCLAFFTNALAN